MVRRECVFDNPFFYFLSILVTYDCELLVANYVEVGLYVLAMQIEMHLNRIKMCYMFSYSRVGVIRGRNVSLNHSNADKTMSRLLILYQ